MKNYERQMYRYRAHVVAELLYSAGMRIGEVALLKEEDIDFDKSIIKITDIKTHRERYGFLNDYARDVLKLYVTEFKDLLKVKAGRSSEYLFNCGMKFMCNWFNRTLQSISKDKSFKSHKFRHSVGYHLLRAGCGIRYIQAILGHVELRSTFYSDLYKD